MLEQRSLYNCMAVRCQLLYSSGGFIRVFVDTRGGLVAVYRGG
jgi:hypothetical protein